MDIHIASNRMSPNTRNEKEIEIAEEIEKRADSGELVSLKRDVLERELSDEHFSQEDISNILDDLIKESPFHKRNLQMEIIYPTSQEDTLLSDFSLHPYYFSTVTKLAAGAYIFMIFVTGTEFLNQQLGVTDNQIIGVTIASIAFSYLSGDVLNRILNYVEMKKPRVKRYREILYPWIALTSVSLLMVLGCCDGHRFKYPTNGIWSYPCELFSSNCYACQGN